MNLTAGSFLQAYGSRFSHPAILGWNWEADDDIFGKTASWSLGRMADIEAQATVDLSAGQVQLTITERSLASAAPDADVVFSALVSFDDRAITVDGVSFPYVESSISYVIGEFNERS